MRPTLLLLVALSLLPVLMHCASLEGSKTGPSSSLSATSKSAETAACGKKYPRTKIKRRCGKVRVVRPCTRAEQLKQRRSGSVRACYKQTLRCRLYLLFDKRKYRIRWVAKSTKKKVRVFSISKSGWRKYMFTIWRKRLFARRRKCRMVSARRRRCAFGKWRTVFLTNDKMVLARSIAAAFNCNQAYGSVSQVKTKCKGDTCHASFSLGPLIWRMRNAVKKKKSSGMFELRFLLKVDSKTRLVKIVDGKMYASDKKRWAKSSRAAESRNDANKDENSSEKRRLPPSRDHRDRQRRVKSHRDRHSNRHYRDRKRSRDHRHNHHHGHDSRHNHRHKRGHAKKHRHNHDYNHDRKYNHYRHSDRDRSRDYNKHNRKSEYNRNEGDRTRNWPSRISEDADSNRGSSRRDARYKTDDDASSRPQEEKRPKYASAYKNNALFNLLQHQQKRSHEREDHKTERDERSREREEREQRLQEERWRQERLRAKEEEAKYLREQQQQDRKEIGLSQNEMQLLNQKQRNLQQNLEQQQQQQQQQYQHQEQRQQLESKKPEWTGPNDYDRRDVTEGLRHQRVWNNLVYKNGAITHDAGEF